MVQKTSPYHWSDIQAHAFHVAPSMGSIVSVINLQGRQIRTRSRKVEQLTKPGNSTVYV